MSGRCPVPIAAEFDINNGVLTFKNSPNYEAPADGGINNVYNITVVATDSDDLTDMMADVTVTVTNEDEGGTLTLSTLQPVDGIEVTTTLTDIDSVATGNAPGTVTAANIAWKWAKSRNYSGTYTDIEGATLAAYTPKPDDVNHYLRATATYTDPQGPDKTEMVKSDHKVLTPRSTNTAPVFNDADGDEIGDGTNIAREVGENTPDGQPVGDRVVAVDSEGDVLTYTLGGTDAASFDIDAATGQLKTKAALDRETTDEYEVMVTATDPYTTGAANSDVITVAITVTNVDEAPKLTGRDSPRFAENTAVATAVATYAVTDDEDDQNNNISVDLTLSGADAAQFSLTDSNNDATYELAFMQPRNYEDPADAGTNNVYNITVVATDSDGQTDTMDVTVTVTNVDEDGTVTLSTVQPRVGVPLTATLTDIDGAVSDVTWMWERGTGSSLGSPETIEGADSATYTPTADDAGDYLRATATSYTDPQGSDQSAEPVVSDNAVEMDDRNTAPEFPDQDMEADGDQTDQERMVAENTDADVIVGTPVTATDPNGDTLTYTLGGTDAASFSIDRLTGQLQTKAALDREERDTYMVTVTATDPSGLSATIAVTIKVTNVDEAPEIMRGGLAITGQRSVRYDENGSDPVGTYTASGPGAATASWTLTGADAGDFDFSNGMLTFRASPDFESPADADMDNMYEVTLEANDGTYIDTHVVTVTVTNAAELGMVSGDATPDYAENGPGDVATYMADGPDAAMAMWSLSGDDMGDFSIDGGMLTFAPMPNYEAPTDMGMDNVYQVTVEATAGGEMDMVDVTVTVTNVNEMGRVTFWRGTDDVTNAPIMVGDMLTGLVEDMDGDAGDTPPITDMYPDISGATWQWAKTMTPDMMASWMDIAGETNAAYMVTAGDTGYYLRATATYTDGHGPGKEEMAVSANMVSMASTNTAPAFPGTEDGARMVAENTAAGMPVGDPVTATDADADDTLTYALSGADMASFDIDNMGQITVGAGTVLDFEATPNTYMVTVTATDAAGEMDTVDVTVTVTNEEETGEVTLWTGTDALTMAPQVGDTITGAVMDPDGGVTGETWQWAKTTMTPDMMASWMDIAGETNAAYMVTAGDTGYYLRVMATYTDAAGTDMAMEYSMPTMMVGAEAEDTLLNRYDANDDGSIDRVEMVVALRDYLFNETITRDDMITLLRLYLFG